MDSLHTLSLESNSQIKINFDGGDLSSDAGLLLFKEFLFKIGADKIINNLFKTNDTAGHRIHKDGDNLLQVIYQIISAYFEDDCADELINEPVMTAILNKDALAFQPTLSRFYNRMDDDTLEQLAQINYALRKIVYTIKNRNSCCLTLILRFLMPMANRKAGDSCIRPAHGAIRAGLSLK